MGSQVGDIFTVSREQEITIAIPRIAKRSYVSLVSSFGIIKQNYRHHYPLQSIFFLPVYKHGFVQVCNRSKSPFWNFFQDADFFSLIEIKG